MLKRGFFAGVVASLLAFTGCQEDSSGWIDATVLSRDFTYCGCCGGWFVKAGPEMFRVTNLPKAFQQDTISVRMRYRKLDSDCARVLDIREVTAIRPK